MEIPNGVWLWHRRMDKNLYLLLEINPGVDQDTIEAAYRRLALRYHPDLNHSPDANLRMQDINAAYAILHNPQKRADYDRQARNIPHRAPSRPVYQPRNYTTPRPARPVQPPPPRPSAPSYHTTPPTETAATPAEQIIIFYLDENPYAFTIQDVETVLMAKNIQPQDNSPRFVEGILEVRRSFVPVIDLRRHIGVPARQGADTRVILANLHGERVGLLVDSIENYVVVPSGSISFPRSMGYDTYAPFIRGFARVGFRVVILLDLAGLLTTEQKEVLLKYCSTLRTLSPTVDVH